VTCESALIVEGEAVIDSITPRRDGRGIGSDPGITIREHADESSRIRCVALFRAAAQGRTVRALAVLLVVGCVATACGSSSAPSSSPTTTAAASGPWSIVALGDSVPSGYHCSCTPYPQLSATGLAATSGATVTATNGAVAGYTTSNVLEQLSSDGTVADAVRKAHVVEVNVGANDIPYNKNSCGTAVDCYAPLVAPMQKNLAAIVNRVHELGSGHKVLVVLLDYWSIWLGGTYARDKGQAYVSAAREMTDRVDAAIKATATESGSAFVSERRAFKGPSFGYIESHYLASDGEHPNAAGHQAIASATETVIENTLHP
jgi:lysophospholipase L1-like esterase